MLRNYGSPSESYLPEDSKRDSSPEESLLSLSDAKIKVARASFAESYVLVTPLFLVNFVNIWEAFYDRETVRTYEKPYLW